MARTGQCRHGRSALERNGSADGKKQRMAANARLLGDFRGVDPPLTGIDHRHLW